MIMKSYSDAATWFSPFQLKETITLQRMGGTKPQQSYYFFQHVQEISEILETFVIPNL
jgi:hypothetical protein